MKTRFDGITFDNHWSKWHDSKRVFGIAVCRGSIGITENYWSLTLFGFELLFWFVKDKNC